MALTDIFTGRAAWANSLQYRDFRLLFSSTLLHSIGMGMEQVALGWLVLEMTDSPFMVGVSSAARMAPFFFLGFVSGAVADRMDRRLFMKLITFSKALVAITTAAVLLTGAASVWHIILLAGVAGCVWAFMMTAKQSFTYDIVGPQLALNGLSLNAMAQLFGSIIGSVLAGVLIVQVGVGVQYVAIGVTHVAALAVLFGIREVGQAAPIERGSVLKNLVGYFQVMRENRVLLTLMVLTAATEVFGFTHQSLLPVFARDVLHVDAVGLGVMRAVQQTGGLVGLVLLANMTSFNRKGLLMFVIAAAFGLSQMAASRTANLALFLALLALINACAFAVDTLYKTLMQANVANHQRGRAMGAWVLSIGTAPIGHMGVGALAGFLGAPMALFINGSVLAFIGVTTALGLPKIRRLP